MSKKQLSVDVQISPVGSVVMFSVLTEQAIAWIEENLQLESWQWLGRAFAVEHRYAEELTAAMRADGLNLDLGSAGMRISGTINFRIQP
jgi:hypothetical protein